jgi:hypothetical protein
MSMSSARDGALRSSVPGKVDRDRIARLEVEADHCPQVLLRVLGLIAQRSIIPFTIVASRSDEELALSVEIEALPSHQAEALVDKVESIVMVRSARFVPSGRDLAPAPHGRASPSSHYLVPDSIGG